MNAWIEQVYESICRHRLLEAGDSVLVALSGGADSVALLSALCNLKERIGLRAIYAAHLHHGLRGASADRDEAFVRSLCSSMSIPLTVSHVDVAAKACEHKESVEEAGRRLRYAFFDEVVSSLEGTVKIAVAHNADDQAETMLFHIARGTGIKGLRGIPIRRDNIVRPLLECSSVSIREYCREQHLSFMVDETNSDLLYARNRIRHRVLPELQHVNSGVVTSLCRLAEIATQEDDFLDDCGRLLADTARLSYGYDAKVLREAHPAVGKRALMQIAAQELSLTVDHAQTEALWSLVQREGQFGGLPHRVVACCNHDLLSFSSSRMPADEAEMIAVCIGETISFKGAVYQSRLISFDEFLENSKIHKNFLHYCISYDMITNDVRIRSRMPGDRLCTLASGGSKTLKKLFNEWGIPTPIRANVPIVCDGAKSIAALGYGVDRRYIVSEHTCRILYFEHSI